MHLGIPAVEETARRRKEALQSGACPQNPFLTESENIELAVRLLVRPSFTNLIDNALSDTDKKELEHVLFDVLYPALQPY
jgi:hypothetical protein